jgi:peptide/nickel transport system substrate-binding protein
LNYNGYCSPEVDKLIDQQSIEGDQEKHKQLVCEIERKLAEGGAGRSSFTTAAPSVGSRG